MGEGDLEELTPSVLWAQREKMIIITVKYQPTEVRERERMTRLSQRLRADYGIIKCRNHY